MGLREVVKMGSGHEVESPRMGAGDFVSMRRGPDYTLTGHFLSSARWCPGLVPGSSLDC